MGMGGMGMGGMGMGGMGMGMMMPFNMGMGGMGMMPNVIFNPSMYGGMGYMGQQQAYGYHPSAMVPAPAPAVAPTTVWPPSAAAPKASVAPAAPTAPAAASAVPADSAALTAAEIEDLTTGMQALEAADPATHAAVSEAVQALGDAGSCSAEEAAKHRARVRTLADGGLRVAQLILRMLAE